MKTQIRARLLWYAKRSDTPKPAWFYRTNNWVTDPKEVERIMRERGLEL